MTARREGRSGGPWRRRVLAVAACALLTWWGPRAAADPPAARGHCATVSFGWPQGASGGQAGAMRGGGVLTGAAQALVPPDPALGVSPAFVVAANATQIVFLSRDGVWLEAYGWPGFLGPLAVPGAEFLAPRVIYLAAERRWLVVVEMLRPSDLASWLLVAVSDDADPRGAWIRRRLEASPNGSQPTDLFADFPAVAVHNGRVLVTMNMFSRSTFAFVYAKLRVIELAPLLDGAPLLSWTDFWDLRHPRGTRVFTLMPAAHHGVSPVSFFAATDPPRRLSIFGLEASGATLRLTARSVRVAAFADPPAAAQPQTGAVLDTGDTRVLAATWRSGRLIAVHTLAGGSAAAVRLYETDTGVWPAGASLVGQVSFDASPAHQFHPSVAVNRRGDVAVFFQRSGEAEFPGQFVSVRRAGAAPGAFDGPRPVLMATASYRAGSGVRPWGSFTTTGVDTRDDLVFWHAAALPDASGQGWQTWALRYSPLVAECPGDLTGDGAVDAADLGRLLSFFGTPLGAGPFDGDLDEDGDVDLDDLIILLTVFGLGCP